MVSHARCGRNAALAVRARQATAARRHCCGHTKARCLGGCHTWSRQLGGRLLHGAAAPQDAERTPLSSHRIRLGRAAAGSAAAQAQGRRARGGGCGRWPGGRLLRGGHGRKCAAQAHAAARPPRSSGVRPLAPLVRPELWPEPRGAARESLSDCRRGDRHGATARGHHHWQQQLQWQQHPR